MIILTIILGYLVVCGITLIVVLNLPYMVIKNKKGVYDENDIAWAYNAIDYIKSTYTIKTTLSILPFVPWFFLIGVIWGIRDNQ